MNKMCFGAFALTAFVLNAAMPIAVSIDEDEVYAVVLAGTLDETSALYLVWDDEDRGTNLSDWPAANRVRRDVVLRDGVRASLYCFDAKEAQGRVFRILATSKVRLLEDGGSIYIGNNQYIDTGVKSTGLPAKRKRPAGQFIRKPSWRVVPPL